MKHVKFALDHIFTFMLFVSIGLLIIMQFQEVNHTMQKTVEMVDCAILGGYYLFFAKGLYIAKNRLKYCKQHWILIVLLILPFVPVARVLQLVKLEHLFKIGADSLWHIFDELELL